MAQASHRCAISGSVTRLVSPCDERRGFRSLDHPFSISTILDPHISIDKGSLVILSRGATKGGMGAVAYSRIRSARPSTDIIESRNASFGSKHPGDDCVCAPRKVRGRHQSQVLLDRCIRNILTNWDFLRRIVTQPQKTGFRGSSSSTNAQLHLWVLGCRAFARSPRIPSPNNFQLPDTEDRPAGIQTIFARDRQHIKVSPRMRGS